MIKVRLFQNCILNETYQNVFSLGKETGQQKNVLERYLDTLNHYDFQGDYIYYENSGTLVISYTLGQKTIYDFNYMKVEEYNDKTNALILTRYCFIQKISLKNDCAYIDYIEDVWSSYGDKIAGITKSYWSNARLLNYPNKNISLRSLPINYDGVNKIDITQNNITEFSVIVKVQIYNTSKYGESTERDYNIYVINYLRRTYVKDAQTPATAGVYENITDSIYFTYEKLYKMINDVIKFQSGENLYTDEFNQTKKYFEIEDFMILPKNYLLSTWMKNITYRNQGNHQNVLTTPFIAYSIVDRDAPSQDYEDYYVLREIKDVYTNILITNYSKTFTNDFKRISLGTFNTQIPVVNNGNNITVSVYLYFVKGNSYVLLNALNTLIDISEDFIFTPPFNSILGEENSLRKLSRVLNNLSLGIMTGKNLLSGVTGLSSISSDYESYSNRIQKLMYTRTGRLTTSTKKLELIEKLKHRQDGLLKEIPSSIGNMMNLPIPEIIKNNAPVYSSTYGTKTNSDGIVNAKFGIFDMKINPSNSDYVNKSINNCGFTIYEIIDDFSDLALDNVTYFLNNNLHYNFIQFDSVNLYGSFGRDIALLLNSILENGVKIWFDYQMTEDNYAI